MTNNEINSLKKLTSNLTITSINLGRYTFVTICLFEDISFTDVVKHLLKNEYKEEREDIKLTYEEF